MTSDNIIKYCLENFDGVVLVSSWGERGIFYNPDGKLKRGIYILTIKEKDGDNDKASKLDRDGIYRVNTGVRRETFEIMFGTVPGRPCKGGVVDMNYDFTAVDRIMPHPVYGWMGWICALSPSDRLFEELKPLIGEAYEYAKEKYKKRKI